MVWQALNARMVEQAEARLELSARAPVCELDLATKSQSGKVPIERKSAQVALWYGLLLAILLTALCHLSLLTLTRNTQPLGQRQKRELLSSRGQSAP